MSPQRERLVELLSRWERRRAEGETLDAAALCRDDPDLLPAVAAEIDALRAFDAVAATCRPGAPPAADAPPPELPGYEILGELGRGGMGVVYKAKQAALGRVVALKTLRAGPVDADDLARFRTEAELLARLQHPHIVQVFEVGTHRGQPYLALEYVDGGSLAQRLVGGPLPPRPAAELVRTLAAAVHAAHQAGVVHRDLKPGNVLVAGGGGRGAGEDGDASSPTLHPSPATRHPPPVTLHPKITDFGLAKRLDAERGQTRTGAVLGTPSYMAPEQARGEATVGPAADVWALGAILYECLTGRPPFRAADIWGTLHQVIHQDPVAPRLLNPQVPRDLETVCLTCLRKEPARRYPTAAALADDLRRFLAGEPVTARPVGAAERGWRWCRRNPSLAAALAAVVLSLVVGSTVSVVFGLRASRRAALAQKRLGQIEEANAILASIFRDLDPYEERQGGPTLRARLAERLDQAAARLDGDAVGDPLTVARLQAVLGYSYLQLGYPDRALRLLEPSYRTRTAELGPDHPDTLEGASLLAIGLDRVGRAEEAFPLFRAAFEGRTRVLGLDHPDTLAGLFNLALAEHLAGDRGRAVAMLEEVVERQRRRGGADGPDLLHLLQTLAAAHREAGRVQQALVMLELVEARQRSTAGPDHPETLSAMSHLALAYQDAGQPAKALPLFRRVLERRGETLGPTHPDTLAAMSNLALAHVEAGRPADAVPLLTQALERLEATQGKDHPDTLSVLSNLGTAHAEASDWPRALPLLTAARDRTAARFGPDQIDALGRAHNLANALRESGQPARALELQEPLLGRMTAKLGADHPYTEALVDKLSLTYRALKRPEKARALREAAVDRRRAKFGPDHRSTLYALVGLAQAHQDAGQPALALPLLHEAIGLQRATLGPDHLDTSATVGVLAALYEQTDADAAAEPLRAELAAARRRQFGPDHLRTAAALASWTDNLLRQRRYADAEGPLRECLRAGEACGVAWLATRARGQLAESLLGQGKFADAEPLLLQARAELKSASPEKAAENLRQLVRLYEAWGKPAEAATWRKELERATRAKAQG